MLIFGGIILDKMGVRFTGTGACLFMVFGCGLKYYAISTDITGNLEFFGMTLKLQVALAALGFAIFGVGVEIAGITVSMIIVKWF